jgi:hypothetical protein
MFVRSVLAGLAVVLKLRMFVRSVLADLAAVPKLRMFGRSVRLVQVVALKFRAVVRNAQVRVRNLRTFDPSGLRLVPRLQGVQRVLGVHNDPAMRLARPAGIVTRLVRVRISRRDNNPAMQLVRVAGIVTRLVRVRVSSKRGLDRPRRGVLEHPPDKVTRASAIELRAEGDLGRSENTRCEPARIG